MIKPFPYLDHFVRSEFDSPDVPGSGVNMSWELVQMLDKARKLAKFPFIINSGYRTRSHNALVGGTKKSSHLHGLAVDIKCSSSHQRFMLIYCLMIVGFTRIGIKKDFIHVDIDYSKPEFLIWLY